MKKLFLLSLLFFSIISLAQAQVPTYVPTNGLVGWWPFNGNANDESGNGNHAVNYGSLLTTDRNGSLNSAYSFDSTYMVVNNSTSMNFDSISINLWYWNHEIKNGCFVSKHQSGTHNSSFVLYWENLLGCGPQWYITSSASGVNSVWASSLCDTTHWHMLSATFANGIMRMYYDGVLFQTTNQVDIKNTSLPIVFGGGNSSPTQLASFTNAKLDDIGIWNRARDSAEIASLYNANATGYEKLTSETLELYPNPASSILTVNNNTAINEANILSNDGRFIQKTILTVGKNSIDITSIENGIYILKVGDKVSKFSVVH